MGFKTKAAIFLAKTSKILMKLLNKKATQLPGKIAHKVDSNILRNMKKPLNTIAVTGTNGKTTTVNMIADIIDHLDNTYISNRLGSNTYHGLVSAILDGTTLTGRVNVDYAIYEVDELWSTNVLSQLEPKTFSITNLFQDSFERNANIYYVLERIKKGITKDVKLILNATDSISSFIDVPNEKVYFSVDNIFWEDEVKNSIVQDLLYCPNCEEEIVWDFQRYHHIGNYHCEKCGFTKPKAKYSAYGIDEEKNSIMLMEDEETVFLPIIQRSIETVYNQVCAYATLRENGFDSDQIIVAMKLLKIIDTRFETVEVNSKKIIRMVAKGYNPVANSRVLDFIGKSENKKTIIYLFDNIESNGSVDARTTGWNYSIDYDLLRDNFDKFIFKSRTAEDFIVPMLMRGIDKNKIVIAKEMSDIIKNIDIQTEEDIYILHDIEPVNVLQAKEVMKFIQDYVRG